MRIQLKSCIVFIIFLCLSASLHAKTSVWVAEKEGRKIIFAGSVHLLKPSQLPLPDAYIKALDASERIVFELDMGEINPVKMGFKMGQTFALKNGETLQTILRPDVWSELEKTIKKNKVLLFPQHMDAAFVSFTLPILIWQKQGYQAGIDEVLYKRAKQQGKIIEGLETFDEQLSALKALKKIDPNSLIIEMLKELADPKLSLDKLITDLYRGDQRGLKELITTYKQNQDDTFYQRMLVHRNQAWLIKIEGYIQDGIPTLIVVGAMHLVGEEGLLEQLAKQGYTITYY